VAVVEHLVVLELQQALKMAALVAVVMDMPQLVAAQVLQIRGITVVLV
jgi:hypothetical protein